MGLALLTMSACSESASDDPAGGNIRLSAAVGDLQSNSRAVADPYLSQNGENLKVAVWFRNQGGEYENSPDPVTNLPVHTDVEFDRSGLAYVSYNNKNLKYPSGNGWVDCIGMHPYTGWTPIDNNKKVSHAIDGVEDLMFAQERSGNWSTRIPMQKYEHLLTWIKINICASSHEAIDAWGTIEQITVKSDSEVTIDLETGKYEYGGEPIEIKTIAEGDGRPLTTANHEVGNVFCSPQKGEYALTVTSRNKNGEEIKKTVDMALNIIDVDHDDKITDITEKNWEEARGRCFVFSLYFTPYDVIEGVCTLNSWSNQNEDIYIK